MTLQSTVLHIRRLLHGSRLLQIAALIGLWWAGNQIVALAHLPVPGAVAGMLALLALLLTRRISLASMSRGARWLLSEMLLFFVPVVLAVLEHPELIGWRGLKVLTVILTGTVTVILVTACVVDLCCRLTLGHECIAPELD
jgi:holin-like protein